MTVSDIAIRLNLDYWAAQSALYALHTKRQVVRRGLGGEAGRAPYEWALNEARLYQVEAP